MRAIADIGWRMATAVNPFILPFAVLCGLVLAAVALSFIALFRARTLVCEAAQGSREAHEACVEAMESLRREWHTFSTPPAGSREQAAATVPSLPRPGLNLSNRSQALRMHRRGDAPVEIAAALGIPLQEVDLLLKVHRIVIRNL